MGQKTDIQWADSTVNPTTGCQGCELWKPDDPDRRDCYAGQLHETRLAKSLPMLYAPQFHEVRLAPGRMAKASRWSNLTGTDRPDKPWLNGRPRHIFVGDMGDIFSKAVPFEYLKEELIDVAQSKHGERHIWMILTKLPSRALEFYHWLQGHEIDWPENIWTGTSVTTQSTTKRIPYLLKIPGMKFVSAEPLWGLVDLTPWLIDEDIPDRYNSETDDRVFGCYETEDEIFFWKERLSLVIAGGESGPKARPCDLAHIRSLRDQCKAAGVACFIKQLGSNCVERARYANGKTTGSTVYFDFKDSKGGDIDEFPEDLRIREFPETEAF